MMDKAEYMIMGKNDISANIHNRNLAAEIFGWAGAFAILLACVLNSFKLIKSDSIEYQLLNLGGAGGVFSISLISRAACSIKSDLDIERRGLNG